MEQRRYLFAQLKARLTVTVHDSTQRCLIDLKHLGQPILVSARSPNLKLEIRIHVVSFGESGHSMDHVIRGDALPSPVGSVTVDTHEASPFH
jgi:hypothetical protein